MALDVRNTLYVVGEPWGHNPTKQQARRGTGRRSLIKWVISDLRKPPFYVVHKSWTSNEIQRDTMISSCNATGDEKHPKISPRHM